MPLVRRSSSRMGNLTIAFGDSITKQDGDSTKFGGSSYLTLAGLLSGGRITPLANAGVSGDTTTQMLARIQTDVIDRSPSRCIVLGGTNDIGASTATATIMGNIRRIINALSGAGIEPVLATIPPRNDGFHSNIATLNFNIRNEAQRQGLHLLDFHAILTDPSNGNYKSAYTADGIHPTAAGALAMAQEVNTRLAPLYSEIRPYLTDDKADGINRVVNGTFTGDANADGVADNWSKGTANGTLSLDSSDTSIVGSWQVMTFAASGQNWVKQNATGWSVGDVLEFSGRLTTSGIQSGGATATAEVRFNDGGNGAESAVYGLSVDITNGVFYRRFTVPTGTTSIAPYIVKSTNGTGTVKVSQVTLINLTTLGLA